MSAVNVDRLWKSYDGVPIIEGLNLHIESGSFVTIVGASGCGKSTFLRMLLGQEQPSKGYLLVDGDPLPPEPSPARGIVFQRYSVFPHLTVLDNVILGLEFQASPWSGCLFGGARRQAEEQALKMIDAVGLSHVKSSLPSALSGGMQQRLAIAQALILKPKILLLDEPFGALDPGIRDDMHALITELWRETSMTVFMVTHDLGEAFKLGTRVLTFDKIRHDPQAPEAYGATVTYDLRGYQQRKTAEPIVTEASDQDGAKNDHVPDKATTPSP